MSGSVPHMIILRSSVTITLACKAFTRTFGLFGQASARSECMPTTIVLNLTPPAPLITQQYYSLKQKKLLKRNAGAFMVHWSRFGE
jgi:hypothetical protein